MTTTTAPRYGYADLPRLLSLMTGDEKHGPSATSTLDVLWVLYDRVLDVSPARAEDPERDRFLLSKGHGPMAYYAVLAAKGFLDPAVLPTFGAYESPLGHHPDRTLVPGVEISSGSLGHGLPLAVGTSLGLRARARAAGHVRAPRVVVLVGDGELDEGSNHEALAYAGAAGLDGLTAVVVDNASSTHGWPGGIASRFSVEGWDAVTVDGRDHDALTRAFTRSPDGRPQAVVATVEPRG
ncbi:MAG: transketolase [Actinomycetes bacterium]